MTKEKELLSWKARCMCCIRLSESTGDGQPAAKVLLRNPV